MGSSVVHCKRDPYDVLIDRTTVWGNPFRIGQAGTREEVIAAYEAHLRFSPELRRRLPELRGKVLGCWCAPEPCHGDVLARWANAPRRVLITCSRTWKDCPRASRVLSYIYERGPDITLVSGHAWRGDRDLERIWSGLGGQVETYEADWEAECRPDCWPPFHRKRGRDGKDYCPGAGDYRNHQMAELPGVILCLAFLMPCVEPACEKWRERARSLGKVHYTHGARECADYAEFEVKIPTRRFAVG
jgi:hypothetical protein